HLSHGAFIRWSHVCRLMCGQRDEAVTGERKFARPAQCDRVFPRKKSAPGAKNNLRRRAVNRLPIGCALAILVFSLCGTISPAAAQTDRATLEGTVTDPSGGVVAAPTDKAPTVATAQSQERTTNSSGH